MEIRTAEPLSPISVGDYLYEVSFPDPLIVPRGYILQVAAKQHVISKHTRQAGAARLTASNTIEPLHAALRDALAYCPLPPTTMAQASRPSLLTGYPAVQCL